MKPNSHEASGEHHGQRPVISMSKLLMRRARHFTVSAVAAFAFLAAVTARAQTSVPIMLQAPSVYNAQTPYNAITTVAGGPQQVSSATLSLPTSVIGDLVGKHYEPGVPALMRTALADF